MQTNHPANSLYNLAILTSPSIALILGLQQLMYKSANSIGGKTTDGNPMQQDSGSQPFFHLRAPWQPISINCTLRISKIQGVYKL
jgi:hypothetical protein